MTGSARINPDFNDPTHAATIAAGYARINRHGVHGAFFEALQAKADAGERCHVLDVGAGSGDDAMVLARMGHSVVAAEPAEAIRQIGERNTHGMQVQWLDATVSELAAKGLALRSFDAVLLSAVWQYVPAAERVDALKTLAVLSKPGALIRFQYPLPPSRQGQEIVSVEQFKQELAQANSQLPLAFQLQLDGEPLSTKDSRDRIGIDGTPVHHLEFTLRLPSRAAAVAQTSSASATRLP